MISSAPALHPSMAQPAATDIQSVSLFVGPHHIISAATDAAGTVVATQQYQQRDEAPEWEPSFLESVLAQDSLLQTANTATTVFVADARQLIIPDELYAEAEVALWFATCHQHAPNEPLLPARVSGANYRLVGALAASYNAIFKEGKKDFKFLPLGVSLLRRPPTSGTLVVLTLLGGTAFGALHTTSGLKEGFACPDTNGAELAYNLKRLCQKHGLPEENLLLRCNALTEADRLLTAELRGYFDAAVSAGDEDSVLSSLMRVCLCAS